MLNKPSIPEMIGGIPATIGPATKAVGIVGVADDITFQTGIFSSDVSVETARAGE
ncbi:MAG TPA: hypothetical protein VEC06_07690 [Paucimonas sp.]|nr:hypothetical protein [Paucimonas sp.]